MLPKLSRQLDKFGLSPNEISVYIALLQEGSDTASNIAKKAKLNRSTTYVQLTTLMDCGLVSSYKKVKKTYFSPESPHNIERLIDTKIVSLQEDKNNIESLIPDLMDLYATLGEKPNVKTFEGKEGLKTMRSEVVSSGVDEFHVLYNADQLYTLFDDEELIQFSKNRAEAGIRSHALYNKKGKPFVKLFNQELIRLDSKKHPINADIYVYGDKVSLASTTGKIIGVTIKNKNIASSIRTLFNLALNTKDYVDKIDTDKI